MDKKKYILLIEVEAELCEKDDGSTIVKYINEILNKKEPSGVEALLALLNLDDNDRFTKELSKRQNEDQKKDIDE